MLLITPSLNAEDIYAPLYKAIAHNEVSFIKKWITQYGPSAVNAKDKYGRTMLHFLAIRNTNSEIIEAWIEGGADINARDNAGKTPLIAAIEHNNLISSEIFLKYKALVDIKTHNDKNALMYAAIYKSNPKSVELLIKHGANINIKDRKGNNLLHSIIRKAGHYMYCRPFVDIALMLLKNKININDENEDGNTPLHLAAWYEQQSLLIALIKHGAKDTRNYNGDRARDLVPWRSELGTLLETYGF